MAAQWAGYKFEEFTDLPGEEQSAIVATHRAFNQIEAVVSDNQSKELNRSNKT